MFTISITQVGSSVNGSLFGDGDPYSLVSTTSEGGLVVNGEISRDGSVVANYTWRMLDNPDQFVGTLITEQTAAWCGARNGAGRPSPCLWP